MKFLVISMFVLVGNFLVACSDEPDPGDVDNSWNKPQVSDGAPPLQDGGGPVPRNPSKTQLGSGSYKASNLKFTENLCGAGSDFWPATLTMVVKGSQVSITEFQNATGTIKNQKFSIKDKRQINYSSQGLDCVLDFNSSFEGTIIDAKTINMTFDVRLDEAPLEPDADCEFLATTDMGLNSWNSITGCKVKGSVRLTR